jgi:hypothetical protein
MLLCVSLVSLLLSLVVLMRYHHTGTACVDCNTGGIAAAAGAAGAAAAANCTIAAAAAADAHAAASARGGSCSTRHNTVHLVCTSLQCRQLLSSININCCACMHHTHTPAAAAAFVVLNASPSCSMMCGVYSITFCII